MLLPVLRMLMPNALETSLNPWAWTRHVEQIAMQTRKYVILFMIRIQFFGSTTLLWRSSGQNYSSGFPFYLCRPEVMNLSGWIRFNAVNRHQES
jgi:hypothetical protein